jgi:subtilisin family serine protease
MLTASASIPMPSLPPGTVRRRTVRSRTLIPAILLFVALVIPAAIRAGEIHPALTEELSRLSPTETATALFILDRQADIPALDAALKAAHATRMERHRRVIAALQSEAERSQPPFLDELGRRSASGEVTAYHAYWIANMVVVRATRAAIEEMAGRADIAAIEPGLQAVPDRVVRTAADRSERDATAPRRQDATRGIGVAQGLRAINATRVWHELGINGAGALIGVLDTGVDGNHPALRNRWRGNNGHPWQECWHDVLGTYTTYPNDDASGHGTHVAGTLTGLGVATVDTVGVAWGAQWIAANAIRQGVGSEFNFDVFECLQWFADPDGNPETVDDVPDVLLNAWGVNEYLGYTDCDSRWWPAIDNCEAAGVVIVWTAGGDGPAGGTIRSPGDRATTPYNCFSVGAVDAAHSDFPYPVTSFSSRGPSGCDVSAPLKIKPEVVAPGVDIYSSYPGGTYQVWSGSAMASAHAAGVVALMRSADPDLEVDTIKQTLMETARDGGTLGEDNNYGWGTIDAYAAVVPYVAAAPGGNVVSSRGFLAARPNPFGRETSLRFRITRAGPVVLEIYDTGGRRVRTVMNGMVGAGEQAAIWDGRDASGGLVPAGVYFSRLRSPDGCGQEKMLVIR